MKSVRIADVVARQDRSKDRLLVMIGVLLGLIACKLLADLDPSVLGF